MAKTLPQPPLSLPILPCHSSAFTWTGLWLAVDGPGLGLVGLKSSLGFAQQFLHGGPGFLFPEEEVPLIHINALHKLVRTLWA
jgi:hypothetical protein